MKFRLVLTLLITLAIPTANAVTPIKVIPTATTMNFSLGTNSSISKSFYTSAGLLVVGSIDETGNQQLIPGSILGKNDGFIAKIAVDGKLIWGLRLGGEFDDIATSVAVDADNSFWVLGASESIVALTKIESSAVVINPDSVTVIRESNRNSGLLTTVIWHISAVGELLGTMKYQSITPIMPRDLAISPDGLLIISDQMASTGRVSEITFCNFLGNCSATNKIGLRDTSLRAIVRNKDGTYFVIGKSIDSILKTKLVGTSDGVILTLNNKGVLKSVVRSSLPKSFRTWETVSDSYLLGGLATSSSNKEAAITQFNQSAKPLWSMRIASNIGALTAGSGAVLVAKGGVPTLINWKPKSGTVMFLEFDSKGTIKIARTLNGAQLPIAISYQKGLGYSIITQSGVESEYSATFVPSSLN